MKELALFAGVGGGLLGTQALGFEPVCAVEIGEFQRKVLLRRQLDGLLPIFPIKKDVRSFQGLEWKRKVDVVSGGFPCQPFSSAARGRNNAEDLWPEMRRVISEVEPSFVFAENVTAKAIEHAAEDCSEMGYQAEMLSLSAADLGGDHLRRRFWLLAYTDDKSELQRTINAKTSVMQKVRRSVWDSEPGFPRVDDGVAGRVERYEAIGNGQVPIVAAAALWALANAD